MRTAATVDSAAGVYRILNTTNGMHYIGSSKDLRKRKNCHFSALRRGKHHCVYLQNAFTLYGETAFVFEVLEHTNELIVVEQKFLDSAVTGTTYNMLSSAYSTCGPSHPMYGKRHSDSTRAKIKEARSRQLVSHSTETRAKIGQSNRGKRISAESISKMRATKAERRHAPWNRGLTYKSSGSVAAGRDKLLKQINEKYVLQKYSDGHSINSIARYLLCSCDTVRRVLSEHGVRIRSIREQKIIRDNRS